MKIFRTYLTAASLLFLSFSANAQLDETDDEDLTHIEVGVQATPSITNLDDEAKGVIDYGLTLDWRVPSIPWTVGTGITYMPRSFESTAIFMVGSSYPSSTHMTDRDQYQIVQIPLQLNRRFFNSDNFYFYGYGGALANVLLKYTYSRTQDADAPGPPLAPEVTNTYKMSALSEAGYKPLNFGIVFGASAHITLSRNLFLGIDWRIRISKLKNAISTYGNQDASAVGFQFKLAYNIKGLSGE